MDLQFPHIFALPMVLIVTETGFIPVNEVIEALIASYSRPFSITLEIS